MRRRKGEMGHIYAEFVVEAMICCGYSREEQTAVGPEAEPERSTAAVP